MGEIIIMKFMKTIFSVKNENIHKVITILSLKFKIKSNALISKIKTEELHKIEQKQINDLSLVKKED